MKIIFLSNTEENGTFSKATLEAMTAVREFKSIFKAEGISLHAAVFGNVMTDEAKSHLASLNPVSVCSISVEDFHSPRFASDAYACEALLKKLEGTFVLAPANSRMQRILPAVAARLNASLDTHIAGFEAASGAEKSIKIKRWYYKQRLLAKQVRSRTPSIMTIDPGNYEPISKSGSIQFKVEELPVTLPQELKKTEFIRYSRPAEGDTIKPDADLLFVAGAGWTKKQADGKIHAERASELILNFLKNVNASLGGSKSVVDSGVDGEASLPFMTHLNQVGQTGTSPRHKKGLATCCHGEEPHVVGWRFINERRAVNLNPSCGWSQGKADVLYVADAFEVMEKLNELLAK